MLQKTRSSDFNHVTVVVLVMLTGVEVRLYSTAVKSNASAGVFRVGCSVLDIVSLFVSVSAARFDSFPVCLQKRR